MIVLKFLRSEWSDRAVPLPRYETDGAAGADLRANFPNGEGVVITPFGRMLIPTGFSLEIPRGYEVQLRPRSGLALKHGITLLNAPGTIDSDYRGPIGVILINLGETDFKVNHGDRIAQMVMAPVIQAEVAEVAALSDTPRGGRGFGSTGQN